MLKGFAYEIYGNSGWACCCYTGESLSIQRRKLPCLLLPSAPSMSKAHVWHNCAQKKIPVIRQLIPLPPESVADLTMAAKCGII